MDFTGAQCGVFEVWGPISEGGMSRVWLARHRELSTPVIIKTLLAPEEDGASYATIRNEARLMARIPSPRVVHAVDVGIHEGCPYLVQEYVDGLDLAELDRRRRSALSRGLPLWFVCRVVHQVADGLHSAHQTGVLHRDVKPSNLFGSPQTGIRLGDFGIAVARGIGTWATSGTLRFIAPEALRGALPTRQCDIYSLGATAYDLYYGVPPFTDYSQILAEAPLRFPRARTPEEAYFQHVLAGMLERDPARRVASIQDPLRLLGALAQQLRPALTATSPERGTYKLGPLRIRCVLGDIAVAEADGIVNSANDEMRMRSGVGAALRARGGDEIEVEAMQGGRRALGECVPTGAGTLKCRAVLHAVSAWKEASCNGRTFQRALLVAEELGLRTLAVAALGTGNARVSPETCAYSMASALYWHVLLGGSRLEEVRFVLYDQETYDVFIEELNGVMLGATDVPEQDAAPSDIAMEKTVQLSELPSTVVEPAPRRARGFPGAS
jgi:eukaryotic-like serine/threonine-protein kinase